MPLLKTNDFPIQTSPTAKVGLTQMTLSFAGLAALLAGIGLYGVLAYNVARRTREIGIRMAIGATGANVRGMMVREVGAMLGIGCGLGLAGAYAGSQVVSSLLFGITPRDPAVFIGAAVLLGCIAAVAAYLPTLRATRVDPIEALRYE